MSAHVYVPYKASQQHGQKFIYGSTLLLASITMAALDSCGEVWRHPYTTFNNLKHTPYDVNSL